MFRLRIKYILLFLLVCCSLSAQKRERRDSLVRLLGCDKLQQFEQHGAPYRKAEGHVRFEHNSTLLICDTAVWNVNAGIINAVGKVKIIQNRTVLSSDKLDYFIDENLAQFRGAVVQLQDKDKNTLRTRCWTRTAIPSAPDILTITPRTALPPSPGVVLSRTRTDS